MKPVLEPGLQANFTDNGRRYVFKNPWQKDPVFGYHFNREHFFQIDHRGHCDAQFVQPHVTRYSLPVRAFYVRDNENGKSWRTPLDGVNIPPKEFEFAPGISDTRWRNLTEGIEATLRVFVPQEDIAEIWTVTLKNVSGRARDISLYSYMPVGELCWMTHGGWFNEKLSGMVFRWFPYYAKVEDYYKLKELYNYVGCVSDVKPTSYEISLSDFLGVGGEAKPDGLKLPLLAKGDGRTQACVGAFQYVRTLKSGASATINLLFGPAKSEADIFRLKKKYLVKGNVEKTLAKVDNFFKQHEKALEIETPDPVLNDFVNHWLCKQAMYNGQTMRTTFYPGVRNLLQDAMGLVYLNPEKARHWYLKVFCMQEKDGFMPMSVKLEMEKCSSKSLQTGVGEIPHPDSNIWAPLVMYYYLVETGDKSLLEEKVPFSDGKTLATIYEHVCLGLEWMLKNRSSRGLSLIGQGDWNDPLNMAGYKGKGESVWLTQALAFVLDTWAKVARHKGDNAVAKKYEKEAALCRERVNRFAWKKNWYARGFTDEGRPFGVAKDKEGKMFINSQSWAIMCGAASEKQTASIVQSMQKNLMTPSGPMLVAPAFTKMYEDIGRICLKNPGNTENGSVYCHAAAFYSYALYVARRPEEAYRVLRLLLPGWGTNTLERSGQLPLYIPNYYRGTGAGRTAGKSSNGVGTGTVAWFYRILVNLTMGLRGELEGLRVDPQLPREWERVSIRMPFRGATFLVTIEKSKSTHALELVLDGNKVAGNLIPPQKAGSRHTVKVKVPA